MSCEIPAMYLAPVSDVVPGWSFQSILVIIGLACVGLTLVLIVILQLGHLTSYVNPREQKLVLRISALPLVHSINAVLSLSFYSAAPYLIPIPQIWDAIALCAAFELLLQYLAPVIQCNRDIFYQSPPAQDRKANTLHAGGSIVEFEVKRFGVYQYPVVIVLAIIATEVIDAVLCASSKKTTIALLVVKLVSGTSMAVAILSVIRLYRRSKVELKKHKAVRKIFCVKLIVGVTVIQGLIFIVIATILTNKGSAVAPMPQISYYDITIGIQNALTCVEMVIFGIVYIFVFSATAYRRDSTRAASKQGALRAVWDAINISDVAMHLEQAVTRKSVSRSDDSSYEHLKDSRLNSSVEMLHPNFQRLHQPYP